MLGFGRNVVSIEENRSIGRSHVRICSVEGARSGGHVEPTTDVYPFLFFVSMSMTSEIKEIQKSTESKINMKERQRRVPLFPMFPMLSGKPCRLYELSFLFTLFALPLGAPPPQEEYVPGPPPLFWGEQWFMKFTGRAIWKRHRP